MSDKFDTFFDQPGCPTPGMAGADIATSGGEVIKDGESAKESANSVSGLPPLPTRMSVKDQTDPVVPGELVSPFTFKSS